MKPFKIEINKEAKTIELSVMKMIEPNARVGEIYNLGHVINLETNELIDVQVTVISDEGTAH